MKNIRLETIANMVKEGVTAADIGTDHAFLPIILIDQKICNKVYACDIARGPLQAAQENIAKAGLTQSIFSVLSNGLQKVPDDANACIIAGLGGMTAIDILNDAITRIAEMEQVILEVNRDTTKVREWINAHHYTITDERYIYDHRHDYVAIAFEPTFHNAYTQEECLLGPLLSIKKEPAYNAYCYRQVLKINKILSSLQDIDDDSVTKLQREHAIYTTYLK